jgi:filamentous hemagglutinin
MDTKRNAVRLSYTLGCALYTFAAGSAAPVWAATLPIPCAAGSCGSNSVWVTAGAATAFQAGNSLTVNQTSQNVLLNWQSFNISKDGTVTFVQPSATSVAVNKIFQADPAKIFGALNANGQIYLINQNGILFGAGAQVNVSGLVASTLNITPSAVANGIVPPGGSDTKLTVPSFVPFTGTDAAGNVTTQTSGNVVVEQGATVNAPGGQIFMFAPKIDNRGMINTPDGQTILAAGSSIYLAASDDPSVRGLVVKVDSGGTVTNGTTANAQVTDPAQLAGQILADHGNVTLMGLAVNQLGRISASTSVRANGTIKLVAADGLRGGTLQVGTGSRTEAGLDTADTNKAVDATAQLKSEVDLEGNDITLAAGSNIVATSGKVDIYAAAQPDAGVQPSHIADGSRLYIASGASIDVSGATAVLPMESNVLEVQLRGSELADDAVQRNGVLRGKTVDVDVRQYGTLADGTSWVGTPLANLAGDLGTIQRGILERNVTGGSVNLHSNGDAIVASGAQVNVSGGAVQYQDGYIKTTSVIGTDGKVYNLASAAANQTYVGIANTTNLSLTDQRWGVTRQYNGVYGTGLGQFEKGYIQGADAGSLTVNAPNVIYDAGLTANVLSGIYQRKPNATLTLSNGSLYHPFDTLPLTGAVTFGAHNSQVDPPENVLSSITFDVNPILPGLKNTDGTPFNPLIDPWPTDLEELRLNPALIGTGAAGRVALFANGDIIVPAAMNLLLPAGGSLSANAGSIDIAGSIKGAGANVTLVAGRTATTPLEGIGIAIEGTAGIDVSGAWVNDNPTITPQPASAPLTINGGNVSVAATDGDVSFAPGALIDVSGGAQLPVTGSVVAGKAGQISLSSTVSTLLEPTQLSLGGALRGYGLSTGGTLSLTGASFCIAQAGGCGAEAGAGDPATGAAAAGVPVAGALTADTSAAKKAAAGEVDLAPDFFNTGGFSSYKLASNFGGLTVASQTEVHAQQTNFLFGSELTRRPSSASFSAFASVGMLDALHRNPANIAFSTHFVPPDGITDVTTAVFAAAPDLTLGAGSSLVLDPGGQLSLTSDTRIIDNGLIYAPGGSVSMKLTDALTETTFVAGHKIWLGSEARIDVSGTVRAASDDAGRTIGSVLDGGSVTLNARRGAVELQPGSLIDVSGTTAKLDVQQTNSAGVSTYQARTVSSAGGSVSITAAEAALLGGDMRAQSGDPTHVTNGTFILVMEGNDRYLSANIFSNNPPPYPFDPRVIEIASSQAPVSIGEHADLPTSYDGKGLVSATALTAAGFDSVNLEARTLDTLLGSPEVAGQIRFAGNVALGAGRQITLDAASFVSDGGSAALSAPYISMGQTFLPLQVPVVATGTSRGSLQLNASQIDLLGTTGLGLAVTTLNSSGDIRAIGTMPVSNGVANPNATGSLTTTGALNLTAQQIYPATLTKFTFQSGTTGGADGSINITSVPGAAAGALLAAAGELDFVAANIMQGGVVRAPLGTIRMTAGGTATLEDGSSVVVPGTITLATGSTTSTSADGATIPFGTTQGGFDWVYPLDSSGTAVVYGVKGKAVPEQSVQLNGTSVDMRAGAVIDASGGGDLLATEFVPGPTGTQDVLASSTAFAIIPTSSLKYAPYDPYYWSTSGVYKGESVYMSGGGGVPAGTYAVLPARYALLPGAYYVTQASGYTDLTPGQHIAQADGSTIVSGYHVFAGTTLGDAHTQGFDIRPGTAVQNLAQYTGTSANSFFAAQALSVEAATPRLPLDAGTISLSATRSLTLNGTLDAAAATNGRGVAVDIDSAAIRVVDGSAPPPALADTLDVDANSLNKLGAESILLGGTRLETSKGLQINTQASSVEVAAGARLMGPELLLAASGQVTVDSGATVGATGKLPTTDTKLLLDADGALLRVAASGDPLVSRTNSVGAQGQVAINSGATIQAPGGSLSVESSAGAILAGTLNLSGGSLSITGGEISIGSVPTGTTGTVLPAALLTGLSVANLSLNSRGGIDFYGDANLSGQNVTLSATALQGFGSAGGATIVASDTLTLMGSSAASASGGTPTPAPACTVSGGCDGTGALTLQAGNIAVQDGDLTVLGFSTTALTTPGTTTLSGSGALSVAGDLNLQSGLLTADSGARRTVDVTGGFNYGVTPGAPVIAAPREDALGASLAITAQSIGFDGRALLRSGLLTLTATGGGATSGNAGDITLGSRAALDLSGVTTVFDSVAVASRAGALILQSQNGNITAAAGSNINVAAVDDSAANAGEISVQAANGSIHFAAQLTGRGADFSADAQSLGDFAALETALKTGGFTGERYMRLRGPGDLVVGAGDAESIVGRSVSLTADQGQVVVDGTITSHATAGGSITLAARDNVVVNGTLDARSTSAGEQNGHIELDTTNGGVLIGSAATLAAYDSSVPVQANSDGGLAIRAPQTTLAVLASDPTHADFALAGNLQSLRSITIEGYKAYENTTGVISDSDIVGMHGDANTFMATAPAILAGLGNVRGPKAQLVPGIEIDYNAQAAGAPTALSLQSDWGLDTWRFSPGSTSGSPPAPTSVPGVLTIRSSGDLLFNHSLSDGFGDATNSLLTATDDSWSYRLAAGADLGSSSLRAVRPQYSLTDAAGLRDGPLVGSLIVSPDPSGNSATTMIRTGTGNIDIAAAQDVQLTDASSVIYTAGIADYTDSNGVPDPGVLFGKAGQLGSRLYPTQGGNISISAGRDVVGAPNNTQLVTDWLWRVGNNTNAGVATAWTVNFGNFRQDIGALGGGNVMVDAGRDLIDLSVSVPTIGRQVGKGVGQGTSANNQVEVLNSGNILMRAGNDVAGGTLYDGRGAALVLAGNEITSSPTVFNLYPVIALGDASATLVARDGATIAAVLNPTLLKQSTSQNPRGNTSYFSTYGDDSAVSIRTSAANAELLNETTNGAVVQTYTSLGYDPTADDGSSDADAVSGLSALRIYPGTVSVAALRGDVQIDNSMTLYPQAQGTLSLLAHDDVQLGVAGSPFYLLESDADRALLPTSAKPQTQYGTVANQLWGIQPLGSPIDQNAAIPIHLSGPSPDTTPSRIVALTGDVALNTSSTGSELYFAEPARILAGRDIVQLDADFQNLAATDVSAIIAGRDITYPLNRNADGRIANNEFGDIFVDGPGTLDVWAGRNINLETSNGITSRGNTVNTALSATGADISVETGVGAFGTPDYKSFIAHYLTSASVYAASLIDYMQSRLGGPVTFSDALAAFRALPTTDQAPLVETVFFDELRASGRSAAQAGKTLNDFTRGFAAIEALFPGGNPDPSKSQANPYSGDLSLYFSRIYTLDGGDIRLVAPGGEINAGLAAAPASFGVGKAPSQLGIVAQSTGSVDAYSFGDFAVNESRVFAADGGNILVWSTRGNIDAGRGAKTAISAPPPTVTFENGVPITIFPAALTGSGIQTLAVSKGTEPGDVDLFAPHGVVNANDAGIVAGNLTIAATAVLGADNIKVSGVAVGLPPDTSGLGASLAGVSSVASSAAQAATQGVEEGSKRNTTTPVADAAISWLDVFVEGFGDEVCKASDLECLKRQKHEETP